MVSLTLSLVSDPKIPLHGAAVPTSPELSNLAIIKSSTNSIYVTPIAPNRPGPCQSIMKNLYMLMYV